MSFIPRSARIGSLMSICRARLHRGFDPDVSLFVGSVAPHPSAFSVGRADVLLDQLLEFLGDTLALQGHGLFPVHVYRRDRTLAGTREADADVGVLALPGAVHNAAHHRDVHLLHSRETLAPAGHLLAQVALDLVRELLESGAGGTAAARAGDHQR